jgi:hypothetical protein
MQFVLSAPAAGQHPFTLGFAFRQGDIPSGSGISASLPNVQVVVKNRWPDGSAKFAVVSGRAQLLAGSPLAINLASGTPVTAAPSLGLDDLRSTGVTATVTCGAFGSVNWGDADWQSPFMTWVQGPEMSSWIYRKQVAGDAHLVAWLEVRLYAGGAVEVLPWVENGFVDVPGPGDRLGTYAFTLGSTQRFSQPIALLNHQRTPLISGSALSHWLGSDPGVNVSHDAAYLQATRLVPTYRANVANTASAVTNLPSTFQPLQQGSFPGGMGSAGYHGSIGLLPEWDVLYLTSTAGTVWAAVQRNAYSAGRYGIHYRDELTHRPLRFSAYPTLVMGGGSAVSGTGASTTNTYTPAPTGGTPPGYASTHHPSMGYMAALVTGRWYHIETAQFVATANFLKNGNLPRNGAEGVFQSATGSNTTRGVGWAVRSLAQAACITPDADPLAAEFNASMSANINWYHARYVAQANNPQGWIQPYSDYTAPALFNTVAGSTSTQVIFPSGYVFLTDGYYNGWELVIGGQVRTISGYVGSTRTATVSEPYTVATAGAAAELRTDNVYFEATWMQDFVTAAFGYAKAMNLTLSGSVATRLDEFFAWKARSIVGRFGGLAGSEFLYRDAAQYTIAVAPSNRADWTSGAGPWFADWGALYDATVAVQGSPGMRSDGGLRGGNFPSATSYWGNLQPALAYAVEHNVPGARDAYNRMIGAANWNSIAADFDSKPVWAVRPR